MAGESTLNLESVAPRADFTVVRDGWFRNLGYLNASGNRILASLYDEAYLPRLLANPAIGAVIVTPALASKIPAEYALGVSEEPLESLFRVHEVAMDTPGFYWDEDFPTEIHPTAEIHPRAYVAPTNVRIGPHTRIGPNATILERSIIGAEVVIWPGVTIGADGFEARYRLGHMVVIPHVGGVHLADRVHVQANSVIDRSLFGGFTEIGEETKIGSLVNIAHNARIGRRTKVIDSVMVAGGAVIGDDCWLAPGVTVGTGVVIGDRCVVGAQSFVKNDLPNGARAWGIPARPASP